MIFISTNTYKTANKSMESLKYSIEQVRLQGLGEQRIDPKDIADIEDQYGISG